MNLPWSNVPRGQRHSYLTPFRSPINVPTPDAVKLLFSWLTKTVSMGILELELELLKNEKIVGKMPILHLLQFSMLGGGTVMGKVYAVARVFYVAIVAVLLSVPVRSGDPSSATPTNGSSRGGMQLTQEVDLEEVQKLLDRQRLGYVEGFIGRVAICGSPKYSSAIGVSADQAKSIAELVEAVELRPNLVENVISESKTPDKSGGNSPIDELIADVKRQILMKETELHATLNDSQYRRLIAIQANLVGPKLLADSVVAHFCELTDGEKSALKKLAKDLQKDLGTIARESVSKTESTLRYFESIDDFEEKAFGELKTESKTRFRKLESEGQALCRDANETRRRAHE